MNFRENFKPTKEERIKRYESLYGTLIFKWNEEQIKLKDVLACFDKNPLFGNKRSKTHWLVFIKENDK